jgi:conjugal transfer ATP-binding protein TraC
MQVDDIADFLDDLHGYYQSKSKGEFILDKYIETIKIGHFLSESLQKFTTKGEYGRFFNGRSNISLDNQLVVTELNNLPDDLKKVLVLAVSSIISDEVYRGDNQPTLILLDEAWQTLSENPTAASFVEGLYRKVRKHNGGVGIVTQSVIDLCPNQGKLKHLGSVLTGQSAFHFMIADKNFDIAMERGIINVSPFEATFYFHRMPNSKSIGYKFSEIFIKGADNLSAVVRLHVEPYTYLVNTSDPNEKDYIMHLTSRHQKAGHSKKEALIKAIEDCYNLVQKLGGIGQFSKYAKLEMEGLRAVAAKKAQEGANNV